MSLQITFPCEKCNEWPTTVWLKGKDLNCHNCQTKRPLKAQPPALQPCPVCETEHVYKQKDFNRKLGILLLLVGIAGSFYTYGMSLLVVAIFDWWLYRHVGEVGLCYRCHSQFRGSPEVEALPPFTLQLHDYYKSLKK